MCLLTASRKSPFSVSSAGSFDCVTPQDAHVSWDTVGCASVTVQPTETMQATNAHARCDVMVGRPGARLL
ncbi:unnamed protein product [Arctogadus glacialis]